MTTIAIDGDTIAWDSRILIGNDEFYDSALYCDKVRVHDGKIFAVCGDAGMMDFLITWWENGAHWDELPDHSDMSDEHKPSWELLVIDHDSRKVYSTDAKGAVVRVPPIWAMGTGALAAKAAMYCGKDAVSAVGVAAALCVGTGGKVNSLEIAEHVL